MRNPWKWQRLSSRTALWSAGFWAVAISIGAWAQRTWTGLGDMEWSQPDSTSWDGTYERGDNVVWSGTGLGTIQISGTVNPNNLLFTHTTGSYIFTNTAAALHASGGLTNMGGGVVQFGNMSSQPLAGLTWTGATYVANGSELRLTRATHVGLPTSLVHLNGGTLSFGADNTALYLVTNPIVVGVSGATIRVEYTSNQTRFHLLNAVSGVGELVLQSLGNENAHFAAGLGLSTNNSAFSGRVVITARGHDIPVPRATARMAPVWFTNALSMFPNASEILVLDGGSLGVDFALTDADLVRVRLAPRGGLAARGPSGTFQNVTAPMARIPAGGLLLLDNFLVLNSDRYPDHQPLALTNNQLSIVGRNASSSPINEVVGDMSVVGAAHIHFRRPNSSGSGVVLAPASLATPGVGSSLLLEIDPSGSLGETASHNSISIVSGGARPAVTNGMLPPSLQYYEGGNVLGHFVTYGTTDTNRIVGVAYTSTDINTASSTDLVNIATAAQTLTSSRTIHALRLGQSLTLSAGVTLTIGSGGLLMSSVTISGGELNFGDMPAYIGAYNAAAQGHIHSRISGTGGLIILGTSQTLNITNSSNSFTGGIWINGGSVRFVSSAANGNDVTINSYGRLIVGGTTGTAIDRIGGLRGNGLVSAWVAGAGTSTGLLEIAAPSGTYQFEGAMTNGQPGRIMGLIKSGGSTQILSSTFVGRYTGPTIVSGGVLQVDGNLARSPVVRVANGSRLQGTGLIASDVVVTNANSTLAPGASAGTLTIGGNVTMSLGAIFEAEILGPLAGQYDTLVMSSSSTLRLGGATLSVIAPSVLPLFSVYPIISGWGFLDTSRFDGLPDGTVFNSGPNQFRVNYGTEPGYGDSITLTVIPEPSSLSLPAFIGLFLFLRRRFLQHHQARV